MKGLSPSALASLRLTEQGRMLLESGKPDDAISILERAINLNPTNGQNYYYLSEAWLFKGRFTQAEKFNGLAEIDLKEDPEWAVRVMEQGERIRQLSR
jgi:tetratricopeptide (TPR) repeat protein